MVDARITELAYKLVNHSICLKKGEKVLIEAFDIDYMLVNALIKEVYKVGGFPFVELISNRVKRLLLGTSKEHVELMTKYDKYKMEDMDAYIGIRGEMNSFELSDVSKENNSLYASIYQNEVHHNIRVKNTKWVVLRYPTPSFSQMSNMSTESFENFYFNVCCLDYDKMDKAMDNLKVLMEKTDKVRIVAPNTDITFSIKGMNAIKCSGDRNIPDGEIYTAPVKTSVNGKITYNTSSFMKGYKFENVSLEFKDGKIINATCSGDNAKLNSVFDIDEGARYVGEFSFGINPYITKAMGDILFDEKITGSIHFTPGSCYEEADNGNESSLHWDLVLIQTKEYGGGEIYFDDVLIRKDGIFVLDSLKCLNPENLI